MSSTTDYQNPQKLIPRRDIRRSAAKALGFVAIFSVLAFSSVSLWFGTMLWLDQRLVLTVVNHAAIPTDVTILEVDGPISDPDAPIPVTARTSPVVAVRLVATGQTVAASVRMGRDIGWSVVHVSIGAKTYEGGGTTLLDHHGPHRYTIDVYDDRVIVTHHSSRRTVTSELRAVPPVRLPGPR